MTTDPHQQLRDLADAVMDAQSIGVEKALARGVLALLDELAAAQAELREENAGGWTLAKELADEIKAREAAENEEEVQRARADTLQTALREIADLEPPRARLGNAVGIARAALAGVPEAPQQPREQQKADAGDSRGAAVSGTAPTPTPRDYQIALRHDDMGLDDVVVRDVAMFRMERMDDDYVWLACYLTDGQEIVFDLWRDKKTVRYKAREPLPDVVYERSESAGGTTTDAERPSPASASKPSPQGKVTSSGDSAPDQGSSRPEGS